MFKKTMTGLATAFTVAALVVAAPLAASAEEAVDPATSTTVLDQTVIEPSNSSETDKTVDAPASGGDVATPADEAGSGDSADTSDQAAVDSSASSDADESAEVPTSSGTADAPGSAETVSVSASLAAGCTVTPQRPFRDDWENIASPIGTSQYTWQTWDGVVVAGPQDIPRGGLGLRAIPGVCSDGSPAEFAIGTTVEWWYDYLLTPPDITRASNTVPLPTDDGVVYKDVNGGVISGTVPVPSGGLTFTREPAPGYFFPDGTQLSFHYEYIPDESQYVSPVGVSVDDQTQSVTVPDDPNFTYVVKDGEELQPGVHVLGPVGAGIIIATPKSGVTVDPNATIQWPFNFPPQPPKFVTPPALVPIGDHLPIPAVDGVVYSGPNGVVTGTVTLPEGQEQCFDAAPVGDVKITPGAVTHWCFTYTKPSEGGGGTTGGDNSGGTDGGGSDVTNSGTAEQHQAVSEPPRTLAVTGGSMPTWLPTSAVAMLIVGGAALFVARRRKQVV